MGLLKTRSRLVSFRLSPDELENLRVACLMLGARNVSDFARRAVLDLAESRVHPEAQILDRFSALQLQLTEIENGIRHNGDMLRVLLKNSVNQPFEQARIKGA
jgi:hypothetical protein